jgi:DNA helicase II / ATP-dependent DNA helicase PcrA
MRFVKQADWKPSDGLVLEDNAITAVKSITNVLVVAGPGAGKTELLAQRACYLLQTNTCQLPRKILAISFKRDAAANLKHRVHLRCGDELSRRFDSYTFDAFSKQLLDRFRSALPADFLMHNGYELFSGDLIIKDLYRYLDETFLNTTDAKLLIDALTIHRYPLPQTSQLENYAAAVLRGLLDANPSKVNFRILMRLCELMIRANPKIRTYLRQTYQYVFLDEFQDTTDVQYDFLKSCFSDDDSDTVMTAVGDDKQSIMRWANARPDIFPKYLSELNAQKLNLKMNFRSAPRLVQVQNYLMEKLLGSTDTVTPSSKWEPGQGEVLFHVFQTLDDEMALLHQSIHQWTHDDGLRPRDIVLLVKQRLPLYAGSIIEFLNQKGINARDENELQDILSEELPMYIINMLFFIYKKGAGKQREDAFTFMSIINTEFDETQLQKLNWKMTAFATGMRVKFPSESLNEKSVVGVMSDIINLAGIERIQSVFSAYRDGKFTEDILQKLKNYLLKYFIVAKQIVPALDLVIGTDSIPVMTIHKSKGLEFHTVVFVGFEDDAFWSYATQADEDKRAFFVALSRAKERVVFTCCKQRKDRYGLIKTQKVHNIREIFLALRNSDIVNVIQHNENANSSI